MIRDVPAQVKHECHLSQMVFSDPVDSAKARGISKPAPQVIKMVSQPLPKPTILKLSSSVAPLKQEAAQLSSSGSVSVR